MLLGILCVVSGCILMFVKRDIILICVLVFVGVALFLLVAKPAQTKKKRCCSSRWAAISARS